VAAINTVLPADSDALLALEPEELAGYLFEYLNQLPPAEQDSLNMHTMLTPSRLGPYYPTRTREIINALAEAWAWLEREGLLVPIPAAIGGHWHHIITRRGKRLRHRGDVESFATARLLPHGLLHPNIAAAVSSEFLRGDYESAVFKAFKEVEVAVRAAGEYADTDLGVGLMRKAYHPETGPLTDMTAPTAEREARFYLFVGAIGAFKNPPSHRRVDHQAEETAALLMFASLLLRIVDDRPFRHIPT